MRISRRRPKPKKSQQRRYRTNQYIRAPQVRLVDETGQNIGVVETAKALAMAQEKGLDLVEVSPLAQPPVVKIINYSKLKYQEEKERRKGKSKQRRTEIKGLRLSLRIGKHDKEVRLAQAEKFLNEEDKVKIEMILRGRERRHQDLAKEIINEFINSLNQKIETRIEQPLIVQGGRLSIIIARK